MYSIFTPAFYALLNYTNVNQLLIYCLVSSHDHEVLYTTAKTITEETGLSAQTIRTCLDKLEKSGDISVEATNKYSIISLLKFDDYINKSAISNKQKSFSKTCTFGPCVRARAADRMRGDE